MSLQPNGTPKRLFNLNSAKKDKKKNLWKIPLFALCILSPIVAWLGFGEQGLIHLYHTEMERQAYTERIRQLTEEKQALLDEIKRLRTDMEYVESVARQHFNMIKSNEVIYRFGEEKRNNDAKALPKKSQQGYTGEKSKKEALNDEKIK